MLRTKQLKRLLIAGGIAALVITFAAWLFLGADSLADYAVAILPTLMGIVCAMQDIKNEPVQYRKKWGLIYLLAGALISAAILYQQSSNNRKNEALKQEITRIQFKIENVLVSFRIRIPLEHPALSSYREQVERCAKEIVAAQDMRCGAQIRTIAIKGPTPINEFLIPAGSELYPKQQTLAYTVLDQTSIWIGFFKDASASVTSKPDLAFPVHKSLNDPCGVGFVSLYYDIEKKSLFVKGDRVPTDTTNWRTNGRITSVLDLSDSFVILRPTIGMISMLAKGGFSPDHQIVQDISHSTSLDELTLYMSQGWQRELTSSLNKYTLDAEGNRVYFLKVAP